MVKLQVWVRAYDKDAPSFESRSKKYSTTKARITKVISLRYRGRKEAEANNFQEGFLSVTQSYIILKKTRLQNIKKYFECKRFQLIKKPAISTCKT